MAFWKYIGEFLLFRWLFGNRNKNHSADSTMHSMILIPLIVTATNSMTSPKLTPITTMVFLGRMMISMTSRTTAT